MHRNPLQRQKEAMHYGSHRHHVPPLLDGCRLSNHHARYRVRAHPGRGPPSAGHRSAYTVLRRDFKEDFSDSRLKHAALSFWNTEFYIFEHGWRT